MILQEIYNSGKEILKNSKIQEAENDALLIFEYCFNMSKIDLIVNKNTVIPEKSKQQIFFEMIKKRAENEPLQYILGKWQFMNLDFKVGKGVLIPREDTEILVKTTLKFLKNIKNPRIIDLCSGSGCIAITFEKMLIDPEIYAVEFSKEAFFYLNENIKIHKSKVKALNKNAFSNLNLGLFDAIVSNPPYIRTKDLETLQKEVKKEPELALNGGDDGLDFYRKICKIWIPKLKKEKSIAFEIGINQSDDVKNIMQKYGLTNIKIEKDLNGIERVISGIKA